MHISVLFWKNYMSSNKNRLSFFVSGNFMLFCVVLFACTAHINFFSLDMRPFQDHDVYYLLEGHLNVFVFLFDSFKFFLDKFMPFVEYDGFFLYKMINLAFLVPLIIFTYLTAEYLYNKWGGVLAAFILITFPAILNIFHKSEINIITASLFSACIFFYIRSNNLKSKFYFCMFCLFFVVFVRHHYSFFLYLAAALPVVFFLFIFSIWDSKNRDKSLFIQTSLLFFSLGLSFLLLLLPKGFFWTALFLSFVCMYFLRKIYHFKTGRLTTTAILNAVILSVQGVLLYSNFAAICRVFLSTGYEYRYYDGTSFSFVGIIRGFVNIFVREISSFYRADMFYVDFSVCFIVFCLTLNTFFLCKSFFSKSSFSKTEVTEVAFTCFACFGFLLLSFGVGKAVKFFAPFYMILAVLFAGLLVKLYSVLRFKAVVLILVLYLFVSGCISLFYPNQLVFKNDNMHEFYYYIEDDYNAASVLAFSKKGNIDILSGSVLFGASRTLDEMDMDFVYMWLRLGGRLADVFMLSDNIRYTHVFFFLYFNDVDTELSLANIKQQAFSSLKQKNEHAEYASLVLKKVIPYGYLLENQELTFDFSTLYPDVNKVQRGKNFSREFLLFVYEVE